MNSVNSHAINQCTAQLCQSTPLSRNCVGLVIQYLDPRGYKTKTGTRAKVAYVAMGIFTFGIGIKICLDKQDQCLREAIISGDAKRLMEAQGALQWGASCEFVTENLYIRLAAERKLETLDFLVRQIDFTVPCQCIRNEESWANYSHKENFFEYAWDKATLWHNASYDKISSGNRNHDAFVLALLELAPRALPRERDFYEKERYQKALLAAPGYYATLEILLENLLTYRPIDDCSYEHDAAKVFALRILFSSVYRGHFSILKLFLKHGFNPKGKFPEVVLPYSLVQRKLLSLHQFNGSLPFVKFWVEEIGIDPSPEYLCSVLNINSGTLESVRYLLQCGVDPVGKPLEIAAKNGDDAICKLLQSYVRKNKEVNGVVFHYES